MVSEVSPGKNPGVGNVILAKRVKEACHRHGAELSTGERGRRRLTTIDPQGEGIEIKGETNRTSHTHADTVGPSSLTKREEAVSSFLQCIEKNSDMLMIA